MTASMARRQTPTSFGVEAETEIELSPGAIYKAPTTLFYGYCAIALISVFAAIASGRPELLIVAGPALVVLIAGLIEGRYPAVRVAASLDTPRILEGELTRIWLTFSSDHDVHFVEFELAAMRSFDPVGAQRQIVSLRRHEPKTTAVALVPLDWGVLALPTFTVRTRRTHGLFSSTIQYRCVGSLRVHLNEEPTRTLLEPNAFRRVVGSHISTDRGEGCEIADIRQYQHGDPLQSINWRISARNDQPWVTLRHPDRSASIVIVIDAFVNLDGGRRSTLRRSIRAAMGLARVHVNNQDPVGLALIGHGRRWIQPNVGQGHLAALTDALLELSTRDWADRGQRDHLLQRLIPPDAVVVAISPLLNDAFGDLLKPLLGRGQAVHVIEPVYELPDGIWSEESDNGDPATAWRLFRIEQHLRRKELHAMGATVSSWAPDEPVESILLLLLRAQRARLGPGLRVKR